MDAATQSPDSTTTAPATTTTQPAAAAQPVQPTILEQLAALDARVKAIEGKVERIDFIVG